MIEILPAVLFTFAVSSLIFALHTAFKLRRKGALHDAILSNDGKTLIYFPADRNLTEYTIPNKVTTILDGAFCCNKLEKIQVSTENPHFQSIDGVLFSADGKTLIRFPADKALKEYTISGNVTRIENGAFSGCRSLRSIFIPDSVTHIGNSAFGGDNQAEIQVSAGNPHFKSIDGGLFSADGKTLLSFSAGRKLTAYTIPEGVTDIGYAAFAGCTSLTSVTIPDSVTSIGDCAFAGCMNLRSLTLPDSVINIGNCAFSGCTSLNALPIPDCTVNSKNRKSASVSVRNKFRFLQVVGFSRELTEAHPQLTAKGAIISH